MSARPLPLSKAADSRLLTGVAGHRWKLFIENSYSYYPMQMFTCTVRSVGRLIFSTVRISKLSNVKEMFVHELTAVIICQGMLPFMNAINRYSLNINSSRCIYDINQIGRPHGYNEHLLIPMG